MLYGYATQLTARPSHFTPSPRWRTSKLATSPTFIVCTCTDSRTRKMFIAPTRNAIASVPAMYSPKSHTYRVGPNHPTGVAAPPYHIVDRRMRQEPFRCYPCGVGWPPSRNSEGEYGRCIRELHRQPQVEDIAWISLPCWRCIPNSFGDAVARSIALAVAS